LHLEKVIPQDPVFSVRDEHSIIEKKYLRFLKSIFSDEGFTKTGRLQIG